MLFSRWNEMPEINKQPPNDIKMSFTFNNLRDVLVRKIRKLKKYIIFQADGLLLRLSPVWSTEDSLTYPKLKQSVIISYWDKKFSSLFLFTKFAFRKAGLALGVLLLKNKFPPSLSPSFHSSSLFPIPFFALLPPSLPPPPSFHVSFSLCLFLSFFFLVQKALDCLLEC